MVRLAKCVACWGRLCMAVSMTMKMIGNEDDEDDEDDEEDEEDEEDEDDDDDEDE